MYFTGAYLGVSTKRRTHTHTHRLVSFAVAPYVEGATYSMPLGLGRKTRKVGCGSSPRRVRGRRATLMQSGSNGSSGAMARYHHLSLVRGFSFVPPNSNAVDTYAPGTVALVVCVHGYAHAGAAIITLGPSMTSSLSRSAMAARSSS